MSMLILATLTAAAEPTPLPRPRLGVTVGATPMTPTFGLSLRHPLGARDLLSIPVTRD